MYLLYADESGTPSGTDQAFFILAGISVKEEIPIQTLATNFKIAGHESLPLS